MRRRIEGPWRRRSAVVVVVAVVALVLTACHLDAVGSSLLSVAPDRSVVVSLRCRHDTEACTGTAVVRVDGLDSEAAPFTVAPGSTGAVVVTLTEEQYALVPADRYLPAEVRLDNTGPGAAGAQTAVRGLRRAGPTTRRVSIAADGSEPNEQAYPGALSEDGRYVAFQSKASNLVPGDTNRANDVFVHDGLTGVTSRVSVASDGTQMGAEVGGPAMSADGRHVAFLQIDVFVHDRDTGATTQVSVATDGTQGDSRSYYPAVSADGRYVAFRSLSSNLVPGDTNGQSDVFVHDRPDGTTTRVSVSSSGAQANQEASGSWAGTPSISADGRYVAFHSFASNLVPGDTNGTYDVFVHDRLDGTTTRASVANGGSQASGRSISPVLSADGRFVAFDSLDSNLVPGDTNATSDVFVHDRATGETTIVSVATDGTQGNKPSYNPAISADGNIVLFETYATTIVAGDTNGQTDVFVHDRATGETTRASVAVDGAGGNDRSYVSEVSADGRHVAFGSVASNLVPGDTNANGEYDVYVRDLG